MLHSHFARNIRRLSCSLSHCRFLRVFITPYSAKCLWRIMCAFSKFQPSGRRSERHVVFEQIKQLSSTNRAWSFSYLSTVITLPSHQWWAWNQSAEAPCPPQNGASSTPLTPKPRYQIWYHKIQLQNPFLALFVYDLLTISYTCHMTLALISVFSDIIR